MDQNIATLLSTMIGGLLALAGGLIANYVTGKTAEISEKKVFLRSKLEELFGVLQEMEALSTKFYENLAGIFSGKEDIEASLKYLDEYKVLLKKYSLIMALYMHGLRKSSKNLLNNLTNMMNNAIEKESNHEYTVKDGMNDMAKLIDIFSDIYEDISSFAKERGI